MALIKCKGCGNMISDKATVCPKCNTPNVEETVTEQPQQAESPMQGKPYASSKQVENRQSNELMAVRQSRNYVRFFSLLIFFAVLCGAAYYLHYERQTKLEREMTKRLQVEKDSLAEVQREIARQDSIRKDSLLRYLISPDLSFFELHGKVKKLGICYRNSEDPFKFYEFDEEGKVVSCSFDGDLQKYRRNNDGYIVEEVFGLDGRIEYIWENRVVIERIQHPNNFSHGYISYKNGVRIKEEQLTDYRQYVSKHIYEYSNYIFDDYGNWIRRDMKTTIIRKEYDEPQTVRYEGPEFEQRVIEYYK